MRAVITIEMDNAAFEHEPRRELERCLFDAFRRMSAFSDAQVREGWTLSMSDSNGNKVGTFVVTP